jgi:hypothetical protein
MFALLSVPLPLQSQFLRDNPDFAVLFNIAALIWLVAVVAIFVVLYAGRLRHWFHRRFTADGRQMAQRLREVVR